MILTDKKQVGSEHPKVALVYDRAAAQGGAERVLTALREGFPDAPLFTSVVVRKEAPWTAGWTIRTSWIQRLPGFFQRYRWWGWAMPFVFEGFDFSQYDVVISVTGEAAKGVITQPHQLHICYLLTPTRYLWSHRQEAEKSLWGGIRPLGAKVLDVLQRWDAVAAQRPDVIIPISRLVAERTKQYYQRATLAPFYPPLTTLPTAQQPTLALETPFFFTWGRHVAYKRFDLVIRAAIQQKEQLVIAGYGPETSKLRRLARKYDASSQYVRFVGRVSDAELKWYLERAKAAVFPQIEDFGIAAGEAILAGCPVILHEKSGVAEILTKNSAVKISEESVKSVAEAMQAVKKKQWSRLDMQREARQYAGARFVRQWQDLVEKQWRDHQKSWQTL